MNVPVEWLAGTPFRDYVIPGAILFGVFGIGSFVVPVGIARRTDWARFTAVGLGVALVGWITVQMLLLGMANVLPLVNGALGRVLAGLALLPSVRVELGG